MKTLELTKWLRENSSGDYRPAAESADLIERLARTVQGTVGAMDALKMMDGFPGLSLGEKTAFRAASRQLKDVLDDTLPEWDALCQELHEANT
jgi:hypothetical protein